MSIIAHCKVAIMGYGYNCRAKARHFTVQQGKRMRTLGSSTGDLPKVPTLRQALKALLDIPERNLVTLIFKPGKFPTISLQSEEKFRVNIREDEHLYRDMIEVLSTLHDEKTALFIEVPSDSQGRFTVLIDDESESDWSEFDWGFRMETHDKRKKRTSKKPRDTTQSSVEA